MVYVCRVRLTYWSAQGLGTGKGGTQLWCGAFRSSGAQDTLAYAANDVLRVCSGLRSRPLQADCLMLPDADLLGCTGSLWAAAEGGWHVCWC